MKSSNNDIAQHYVDTYGTTEAIRILSIRLAQSKTINNGTNIKLWSDILQQVNVIEQQVDTPVTIFVNNFN